MNTTRHPCAALASALSAVVSLVACTTPPNLPAPVDARAPAVDLPAPTDDVVDASLEDLVDVPISMPDLDLRVCPSNYGDCDDDWDNRCETDLYNSAAHCGACGHACPAARPHTVAVCTAATCGTVCATSYFDCDGDPDNGCEADLRVTAAHCGACGVACAAGQRCGGGGCVAVGAPDALPRYSLCRPGVDACASGSACISGNREDPDASTGAFFCGSLCGGPGQPERCPPTPDGHGAQCWAGRCWPACVGERCPSGFACRNGPAPGVEFCVP